jgi:dsDNA-specific endonuclease/ATPase MutS2
MTVVHPTEFRIVTRSAPRYHARVALPDRDADDEDDDAPLAEVVPLEITGALDLHTFDPAEVKELVPDYLDECVLKGISEVRIIHGKGTGVLRRVVHAALDRHPRVVSYRLGGRHEGGWGATLVTLRLG